MEEISLKDYFTIIKKRLNLVIALTIIPMIIVAAVGFFGTKSEPSYIASAKLMVGGPKSYSNVKGELDYETYKAINGKLVSNFNELINMEVVAEEVINNLGLDISSKEFSEKMNTEIIESTEIIKIEVTDKNKELVPKIVQELITVSSGKAEKIMGMDNIEVIESTQAKDIPLKTKTKTYIIIAGILGFVISIFLVFFLEYIDNTVKTSRDIERYLKLPVFGAIPFLENDLIVHENPNTFGAESFRILRTNIQRIKEEKEIKSILITSSNPSEGKSIVSANIAIAMAKAQEKVLLIDGNIKEPKIHNLLKLDNDIGLLDILKNNIDYTKAIKKSKLESNLDILVAGSIKLGSEELLASKKMELLLEKLSHEYDTIIINSPSLIGVTDAIDISKVTDGTMLVCESEKSEINDLKIGKDILKNVNVNILGIVLNKISLDKNSYYRYLYDNYIYYKE